jgi:PAS domain S-box-containing protein
MFNLPFYKYSSDAITRSNHYSPLLCWDIAHPALAKRIQIAEDIGEVEQLRTQYNWELVINFHKLLTNNFTLVVTNVKKEIIWASQGFQAMTQYSLAESIGKNPSFLQGTKTNPKTKLLVGEKLANFEIVETKLLNYRKDGEAYWCEIKIYPIQDLKGVFTHFMAVEKEVD